MRTLALPGSASPRGGEAATNHESICSRAKKQRRKSDDDEDENIDGGDSDGGEDSAEENDQHATERTYFRPDDGLGENIDDGNDVDEED